VLLTNQEYVEVHITDHGFTPQSVATEGVIVWKNLDTKSHRIHMADDDLLSPVIEPGASWSYLFKPGVYAYSDADGRFTGVMRNEVISDHEPVDLALVLDKSGSMAGIPLRGAQQAAYNLISVLSAADRASIIVFSDKGQLAQQLTSDTQRLRTAVGELTSGGSTYYSQAIQLAGEQLRQSSNSRAQVIIFLSDGAPFDDGGKDAILKQLDESIGDACLFAIGYGEQSREAINLLKSMADHINKKNGCGEFYFSTADKTELSGVFGEIYALTQEPGLELFDLQLPETPSSTFTISARVRSLRNGVEVPGLSQLGCVPPASVSLSIDGLTFPMAYSGGQYSAKVALSPGVHKGTITARLSAYDQPARTVVGFTKVTIEVPQNNFWWIIIVSVIVVILGYFFIHSHNSKAHAASRTNK